MAIDKEVRIWRRNVNRNCLYWRYVAGSYKGIGFDTFGIDPIGDEELTRHRKLFQRREMINIENLKNLHLCGSDLFWFGCFPLKVHQSDGAPVRAVAWFE